MTIWLKLINYKKVKKTLLEMEVNYPNKLNLNWNDQNREYDKIINNFLFTNKKLNKEFNWF